MYEYDHDDSVLNGYTNVSMMVVIISSVSKYLQIIIFSWQSVSF